MHLAGVHGDSDAKGGRGQPALDLDSARQCVRRRREGGHEAVPLALLDRPHAAVGGDSGIDDQIELGEGQAGLCWVPLPCPCRPLDVGQQQGHRACGKHARRPLHHLDSVAHRQTHTFERA